MIAVDAKLERNSQWKVSSSHPSRGLVHLRRLRAVWVGKLEAIRSRATVVGQLELAIAQACSARPGLSLGILGISQKTSVRELGLTFAFCTGDNRSLASPQGLVARPAPQLSNVVPSKSFGTLDNEPVFRLTRHRLRAVASRNHKRFEYGSTRQAPWFKVWQTVFSTSGASESTTFRISGMSLVPSLLREDRWAYLQYGEDASRGQKLFGMHAEPNQFTNLAESNERANEVRRLQSKPKLCQIDNSPQFSISRLPGACIQ